MCGIAGIVATNASRYEANLETMLNAIRHRGPDGRGIYAFPDCVLGHVRLSIVDLEGGAQPMLSRDAAHGITFNGEIYGYRDLRAQLPDYPFRTASDTEVILAAYEKYGDHSIEFLPGMFSLAIWDNARKRLLCARDRFGEKPFYYAFGPNGEFLFASEIKALLATGLVIPKVDRTQLSHYLQYLYVHPHHTIYSNVYSLPPGRTLVVAHQKVMVRRYWTLPPPKNQVSLAEASEQFRFLLGRAVEKQLVADVPVAAFLSGGLDSTTIAALASKHHPGIRTITFGFSGHNNELPYARATANKYATDHIELEERDVQVADMLIQRSRVYDEPFADSSNIPTYQIAKAARAHAKVVLTGDGADELHGGYTFWYRPLELMQAAKSKSWYELLLLRYATAVARRLGVTLPSELMEEGVGALYRLRFANTLEAHRRQQQFFSDSDIESLGLLPERDNLWPEFQAADEIDWAMRADVVRYMPGDILVKTDRASMAHGLELRAPFLDVEIASFCISLPASLKIADGSSKRLLREAFSSLWPREVQQREKQGFGAPVAEWLRRDDVRKLREEYLDKCTNRIYSILPFDRCVRYVRRNDYKTWALLVLSIWLESRP